MSAFGTPYFATPPSDSPVPATSRIDRASACSSARWSLNPHGFSPMTSALGLLHDQVRPSSFLFELSSSDHSIQTGLSELPVVSPAWLFPSASNEAERSTWWEPRRWFCASLSPCARGLLVDDGRDTSPEVQRESQHFPLPLSRGEGPLSTSPGSPDS